MTVSNIIKQETTAASVTAYSNQKIRAKDIDNKMQREHLEEQTKGKAVPLYRSDLTEQEMTGRGLSKEQRGARVKLLDRMENLPNHEAGTATEYKEVDIKRLNKLRDDITIPIVEKTPGAKSLIKEYTTHPSQFNKPLQGDVSKFVPSDIEKIDGLTNLISQSELKEGIIVYSGNDGRNTIALNLRPGDTMVHRSFQSTTTRIEVAHGFANKNEIPVIEKILVPPSKGVALPIGSMTSADKMEWEIILQRGLEREFVEEYKYNGILVLVFRVI